jgi:hypothetical protein
VVNCGLKIEQAMDKHPVESLLTARLSSTDAMGNVTNAAIPPMLAVMRDEFNIFTDVSMPLYRRMLETFREKMWLAEPETRQYLSALIEFVDVWERHIRGTMPGEVVLEINHTEQNLHPFYEHLTQTHDRLRVLIAA